MLKRNKKNLELFKIKNTEMESLSENELDIVYTKNEPTIRDPLQFSENSEEYFASNSLWIFSNENKFRIQIQKFVSSKIFIIIINTIIITNCLFLIFETIENLKIAAMYTEYVFTIIFIIEFILKIIAYGFILEQYSYLRDPWNWLDFIVVISCTINLFPQINANLFALRTIRLIRPLKTITVLPHMRNFIVVLFNSLIDVGTVYLFVFFFVIIFAIFGLSLWNEKFEYRCRTSKEPFLGKLEIEKKNFFHLCGGEIKCDNCLSAMSFYRKRYYFLSEIYKYENELNYEEFNYGLTTFNNIGWSLLTVFQVLTANGWNNIMFLLMDGHNYYISLIYFVLCIIVNYYLTVNLTVAVLIYNFRKARKNDLVVYYDGNSNKKIKKFMHVNLDNLNEKKMKKNYQLKYSPIEISKKFVEQFHNLNEHQNEHDKRKNDDKYKVSINFLKKIWRKIHFFSKVKELNQYHKNYKFSFLCYTIYKQPLFQIIIYICILLNGIILALDRVNISKKEKDIYEIINIILVSIFSIEMCILIIGYGKNFFFDWLNIFDLIIVSVSLIEIILNKQNIFGDRGNNSTSIASTFQILRIFRIFRLFRSWESFQIIMESIWETIIRIVDFLILFILFIFMYALLGFQFFHDSLKFDGNDFQARENSNFYNFDNFPNSLLSVFMIIIGDHWYTFFYDCYRSKKNNPVAVISYFVTIISFGNITLLNVFLAYLIDNFQSSLYHLEKNRNVHFFILELIYKSSEISSSKIINYAAKIKNKKGLNLIERFAKKTNGEIQNGSVYNYYLMKLYSKNLEFEDNFEIIAKNKIDFITFQCINSEYYQKVPNKYDLFNKNKTFVVKRTFTLNKIIDNDPKKEEKARNEAIKYIDRIDSYYSFGIDYEKEIDEKTNLKAYEMIGKNNKKEKIENNINNDYDNIENHHLKEESESELIENFTISESNRELNENSIYIKNDKNEEIKGKKFIKPKIKQSYVQNNPKIIYKDLSLGKTNNSFTILPSKTLNKTSTKFKNDNHDLEEINGIEKKYTLELPQATNLISNRTKFLMQSENFDNESFIDLENEIIIMDYSLFLFSPQNKFRHLCIKILKHWLFNYILIFLIIGNLIIICLDHAWLNPNSKRKKTIDALNYFFNIIFIIEALIKIISKGFFLNKYSYLRSITNIIDFICVIIGIIDMILNNNIRFIRTFRVMRLVKTIRIITNNENLYLLGRTLFSSIFALSNLLIVCLIFMILFSLIGVNFFKESLYYICINNIGASKEECLKNNGKWIYNDSNFSNILVGLKVIFELMVAENWNYIMRMGSLTKKSKNYEFYFVVVELLLHMLFLNLIIAIIMQNYDKLKYQRHFIKELTEPEREWVHIQKIFMKFHPVPKIDVINEKTYKGKLTKIVVSKPFDIIISILIILSCCTLLVQHNGTSKKYNNTLTYINLAFTFLFTIELILKLIVYKKLFFLNNWNIFDFIIIILSDILAILNILTLTEIIDVSSLSSIPMVLRLFRIFRILRIFSHFGKLRSLIDALIHLIPSLFGIGLFVLMLLLIYANIGMYAFSKSPYRKYISKTNNFRSFIPSISLLFQCITGEDWVYIMTELSFHDCRDINSSKYKQDFYCFYYNIICYDNHHISYQTMTQNNYFSCGNNFSYFYFISFMIIGPIFIMNLCVVIVIDGFNESIYENEGYLPQDLMERFINLWMDYDPLCTKVIKPYDFILMMKELPPPIGFNYDRHLIQGINDDMKYYRIEKDYRQFLHCKNLIKKSKVNLSLNKPNFILPQSYAYNDFYLTKNGKFYTTDIEVMKLISKFKIIVSDEKYKQYLKTETQKMNDEINRNAYIFSSEQLSKDTPILNEQEKYIKIHFIDACMIISQFAVSKSMNVNFDTLRRNVVNSFTKKLWELEYKNEEIEPFFIKKNVSVDDNKLSFLLACQVLFRFKKKLKEKMIEARKRIELNNEPKTLFGKFSEMRNFKKENSKKLKRVNSDILNKNKKTEFINNMNQIYIHITQSIHNNDIYDTNIYDRTTRKNLISDSIFSGIFYNNDELNEIQNSKKNKSFSHSNII